MGFSSDSSDFHESLHSYLYNLESVISQASSYHSNHLFYKTSVSRVEKSLINVLKCQLSQHERNRSLRKRT